jgi:hypothetical protein
MEHFAWPIAAVAFGVIFLLLFRAQIAGFLTRVKSVSRHGISAVVPAGQRSIEQQADAPTSKDVQDLLQSFDSPALLLQEQALRADLETHRLDSTSDTAKVLVRHLAKTRLLFRCEFVYRLIFGSQIALLKSINTMGGSMSEDDAHQFYQTVASANPNVFPADRPGPYLNFLVRQGLLLPQDGHFLITDFGREFLVWLAQTGAPENKGL